jgi:hypothetical protein
MFGSGNLFSQMRQSIDDVVGVIARGGNIPSENDYRQAIGLAPRQDHRALTLTGGHYVHASAVPMTVV